MRASPRAMPALVAGLIREHDELAGVSSESPELSRRALELHLRPSDRGARAPRLEGNAQAGHAGRGAADRVSSRRAPAAYRPSV